jgi:hypothetical protein
MLLPSDFKSVIGKAWQQARDVPGFLSETEFHALGVLAICAPPGGVIVEIGSFKGKSTLALASVAAHYGLGPVVSIDPHVGLSQALDIGLHISPSASDDQQPGEPSSFDEFLSNLRAAGLERQVETHRDFSHLIASRWDRPIRMLWIDGNHTYTACKRDLDMFQPFLLEYATVALHDTLTRHFEGPIRVFVEDILCADRFGPAAFCNSIGWSQFRPRDGQQFRSQREWLGARAKQLIPFVSSGQSLEGLTKLRYKLRRWRVPHAPIPAVEMASKIHHP